MLAYFTHARLCAASASEGLVIWLCSVAMRMVDQDWSLVLSGRCVKAVSMFCVCVKINVIFPGYAVRDCPTYRGHKYYGGCMVDVRDGFVLVDTLCDSAR